MATTVHASAIVDVGTVSGPACRVWHFAQISTGTRIGVRCSIGQVVYGAHYVCIGDNVRIQNNVSVYDAVTLEDDAFCGPSMVFTNVDNSRSTVTCKGEYPRTRVRSGATLGAYCTVVCGITIGPHAFVDAGAVVSRDVPDFELVVGVPARQVGWVGRYGERLNLPVTGDREAQCTHTSDRYILRAGSVFLVGE